MPSLQRNYFLILLFTISFLVAHADLNVRVWQSLTEYPQASDFPEAELLKNRPNTAIAFTGGGSRAYVASIGYLAGLNKLGLLDKVRYIGGISGGAWATTTYTYAQNVSSDDVLLGDVLAPQDITQDNLNMMQNGCARGLASANLTLIALNALKEKVVDSLPASWAYGVSKTYLEPVGILPDKYFSWDDATVKDITTRNKQLSASQFQIPRNKNRAYSIIGTALVGPYAGAPYKKDTQNYTLLEMTPLYIGQMKNIEVQYKYNLGIKHTKTVGGLVESFGFARNGTNPSFGLSAKHSTAVLTVPEPKVPFNLEYAAAASSYAPGSLVESLRPPTLYDQGLHIDYWSPADARPSVEDTLFADGGSYENIPLISFLQRRVEKIVLFFVSSTPLKPANQYNSATDVYTGDQLTDCLTAFFGVLPSDQANWEDRSYEYEKDQVFATSDYAMVVNALQQKQAEGKGMFATFNLTTVENAWWGIPAGLKVQVTFSYLGRLSAWESKLSSDMYNLLVPKDNADDLSVDIQSGPYAKFPHYATLGGDINYGKANVLADLTGWSVVENADLFRSILS